MITTKTSHLLAIQWLLLGAGVIFISRGLMGPSARLYEQIAPHTAGISHIAWVAKIGVVAVAILFVVLLWRARSAHSDSIAAGVAAGCGVLIAFAANDVLKSLVAERRPCGVVLQLANCPPATDWSFPSNHTVIAFALAAAVLTVSARWVWPALLIAVIVACGRVAEGVHYPHDVVAGAALGFAIVMATAIWLERPVALLLDWLCRFNLFDQLLTTETTTGRTNLE